MKKRKILLTTAFAIAVVFTASVCGLINAAKVKAGDNITSRYVIGHDSVDEEKIYQELFDADNYVSIKYDLSDEEKEQMHNGKQVTKDISVIINNTEYVVNNTTIYGNYKFTFSDSFAGLKRIEFESLSSTTSMTGEEKFQDDITETRQYYASKIYKELGVAAPSRNLSKLSIDEDSSIGYIVEAVDENFVKRYFDEQGGTIEVLSDKDLVSCRSFDEDYFARYEAVKKMIDDINSCNFIYTAPSGKSYIIPCYYENCLGNYFGDFSNSTRLMDAFSKITSDNANSAVVYYIGDNGVCKDLYKKYLGEIRNSEWMSFDKFESIFNRYKEMYYTEQSYPNFSIDSSYRDISDRKELVETEYDFRNNYEREEFSVKQYLEKIAYEYDHCDVEMEVEVSNTLSQAFARELYYIDDNFMNLSIYGDAGVYVMYDSNGKILRSGEYEKDNGYVQYDFRNVKRYEKVYLVIKSGDRQEILTFLNRPHQIYEKTHETSYTYSSEVTGKNYIVESNMYVYPEDEDCVYIVNDDNGYVKILIQDNGYITYDTITYDENSEWIWTKNDEHQLVIKKVEKVLSDVSDNDNESDDVLSGEDKDSSESKVDSEVRNNIESMNNTEIQDDEISAVAAPIQNSSGIVNTGDNSNIVLFAVIACASFVALVWVGISLKRS